jgi:hypothetical protein
MIKGFQIFSPCLTKFSTFERLFRDFSPKISTFCLFLLLCFLKGHGNEADFLGVLQKSVRHRFLTLHFEPFPFGLRIHGDIGYRKTTPRLAESGSRQECEKGGQAF